jgi:hypothetical protein
MCLGVQRSGTTTLYNLLKQHPEIYVSQNKETKFFQYDELYEKGINYYSSRYFKDVTNQKAIGETDPCYIYFAKTAKRIHDDLGEKMKFIVIFRNPVNRAYSQYWMEKAKRFESLSFEDAIKKESGRLKSSIHLVRSRFSYIDRGFYAKQLKEFLKCFPKENFLFLVYEEDFYENLGFTMNKLTDFLGVSRFSFQLDMRKNPTRKNKLNLIADITQNSGTRNILNKVLRVFIWSKNRRYKMLWALENWNKKPFQPPKMPDELRVELYKKYENDIAELEHIIDRDLDIWRPESLVKAAVNG